MPRLMKNQASRLVLPVLLLGLSCVVVVSEGFSFATQHTSRAALGLSTRKKATATLSSTSRHMTTYSTGRTMATVNIRGGGTSTNKSGVVVRGNTRNASTASASSTRLLFATDPSESKCPVSRSMAVFGALWGSLGVVYILLKAVQRVLPIALEPFVNPSHLLLTPMQWGFYGLSCLFFAYAEGYKGFQKKFSPLVVKRSFSLVIGTKQGSVWNYLFAPVYSMGLIYATKRRLITSWTVSLGVASIVAVVKRLPPVWRCILDAGVVVGLSWGSLSILVLFLHSWRTGTAPAVDACLPEMSATDGKKAK